MEPVKKNDKLKGYVLGAVASLVFAGAAISQCSRSKQATVAKQEVPAAESKQQRGTTAYERDWKRSFSQFKEMSESQMRKNTSDLLYSLAEAFPYQSLDCKLVPKERAGEQPGPYEAEMESMTPKEKSRYIALNVSEDADDHPILRLLEESQKSIGSRKISDLITRIVDDYDEVSKTDSFSQLSRRIDSMKDENNMEGILSVIGNMDQLNLEWGGEDNLPWTTGTLYAVYSETGSRAKSEDWELAPDRSCILQNALALRTLHYAHEALVEMMLKNPGSADYAISRLDGKARDMLVPYIANSLLFSGDFDPSSVENLFSSLSPENKRHFLNAIASNRSITVEGEKLFSILSR